MGLDGLELIMAIEEKFGIAIPDQDAEKIRTPRALIEYVERSLKDADERVCPSQRAFYRLRRAFGNEFQIRRKTITPETSLSSLFPALTRRTDWQRLRLELESGRVSPYTPYWLPLRRPRWMKIGIVVLSLIVAATALVAFRAGLGYSAIVFLASATCFVIGSRPFQTVLPLPDVGSLSEWLTVHGKPYLQLQWHGGDIAEGVRGTIREQLGIRKFSDDDSFVDDLGLN